MRTALIGTLLIAISSSTFAYEKFEGGMSGGGGNVIAPRPPDGFQDPEMVERVILDSRHTLQGYLHEKELLYREGRLPAAEERDFSILFQGSKHIQNIISATKLEVKDEEPCFDRQGNPVDGSIRSLHKGKICVSSYNLAAKVHAEEIHPQATALLLHEYSEAVGVSEEKAIEIQKRALTDLEN